MMRQRRGLRVPVHPLLERRVRLLPLHRVQKLGINLRILGEIHERIGIGAHVDLDDPVLVVEHVEVNVLIQEVPIITGVLPFLVHLPYETPNRKVVVVHLEVVVLPHRGSEPRYVLFGELPIAHGNRLLVALELQLVWRANQTVPIQHLPERHLLLFQITW